MTSVYHTVSNGLVDCVSDVWDKSTVSLTVR